MVSWFPSQIWFLCDFCPYLLWGLPHGHFWATSYIFPRPQTPWRQCFPHLSVFPRRIRYSAKATGVPPVVCGWRAKPAEKDCATGSSEEGPCGTTPTGSACPRPGLCSTSPLVSPAVRVPGLELRGGVEDSWRGLHTQQGAQSWHQKTWFCIWLPEGSSCGRGGRRVGIQWREDHLGLTSVLYTWVAGGV